MPLLTHGDTLHPVPTEQLPARPNDHARLDARGLALGCLIARRLRAQPTLLAVARRNLTRWQTTAASNVQPVLREWQAVLDAGLDATIAVLTGTDEPHVRLRQSNPFAGEEIITRAERNALWRQFSP